MYVMDSDEERTDQGIGYIALMLGALVEGGRASEEQTDKWMANLHKCSSYQDMKARCCFSGLCTRVGLRQLEK